MRTEYERREAAEKLVNEKTAHMLKESKEQVIATLQSISLTELTRLAEDE